MSRIKQSVCWWCLTEGNQEPRKWLRTVADIGYEGYVGQEFISTGDPVLALKRAFAICDVSL